MSVPAGGRVGREEAHSSAVKASRWTSAGRAAYSSAGGTSGSDQTAAVEDLCVFNDQIWGDERSSVQGDAHAVPRLKASPLHRWRA